MATESPKDWITLVGETAGLIWQTLDSQGSMSMAKLVKTAGQPRDVVMQSLGWLAREDKISVKENGKSREVSLR